MYQALYRQYRPTRFDAVYGQEHVTRVLQNQLVRGLLGHAYLFTGTRGTGKTTCAKILARAVNCEKPENGNPCNECAACRSILSGAALDVTELDAASNNGVENIRQILSEAAFPPVALKKRVYIIDEVHMLSIGAFNALLKTLEEPPEHVLFILATTELHKVPATILSRCQRFDFRRVDTEVIAENLRAVSDDAGIRITDDALALIARLGDGSVRDAQSLLERCRTAADGQRELDEAAVTAALGIVGADASAALAWTLVRGDAGAALRELDARAREGRDMRAVLEELAAVLRDVLIWQCAHDRELLRAGCAQEELERLAASMSSARAASMIEAIQDAEGRMQRSASGRMEAELALIRAASVSGGGAAAMPGGAAVPDELLQRLAALEEAVKNAPAGAVSAQKDVKPEQKTEKAPEKPKKDEKPAPIPDRTQDKLPDALHEKLSREVIAALDPLKEGFFSLLPMYWDGKTLSVVEDEISKNLITYAEKPKLEEAVRRALGDGVRLVFCDKPPEKKNDAAGFDEIMKEWNNRA
ncbi:MAG: DNA polymerase III subunit gamma/tau [Clostridiales bacterium]|nr:DNA polymerase III subunit gamma/tau [Clostridiales bacterium]